MSMSEAVVQQAQALAGENQAAASGLPRFEAPIVPRASISARALVAVIAIMTFLASLTTGMVMLVRAAANEWQSDVAREITIQIRPTAGRDIETEVAKVVAITRAFPGVAEVRPYSKEQATRLLEPWLGSGMRFEELPVPRLAVVRVAAGAAPDLDALRKSIAEQVPGASLDDHRGFVQRMRVMSATVLLCGMVVLALVFLATILSVTFATHAAIAANRSVIEVLHLIGAKDNFIADHFQRHFLRLGLIGGATGGGLAIALFACAQLAGGSLAGTAAGEQFTAMFGSFSIGALGYLGVLMQVAVVAAVTAAASRRTVNRTIAETS
jgi:cell division transport system permease protein